MERAAREDAAAWGAGFTLGNYAILRRVGVGGMAEVFEAEHVVLRTRVAIKRLHVRPGGARAETLARFLREGRAAALIRHAHVVQVFDVGTHAGAPYLVMEFLDGDDLEGHLARKGPLPFADAVDLLLPVLSAVDGAHRVGLVHRDLKPANVMLARERDGRLRSVVVDFGIARTPEALAEGVLTAEEALLGTPAYLAPEQCQGATQATNASDQYALGVVLYQCVTGRRPFEAAALPALLAAIGANEVPPLRAHGVEAPPAFEAVLRRALAREAVARHPDVAAFARALLPFASARGRAAWESLEAVAAPPREPVPPPAVAGGGRSRVVAAAFAVVVIAAAGAALALRPKQGTRGPPRPARVEAPRLLPVDGGAVAAPAAPVARDAGAQDAAIVARDAAAPREVVSARVRPRPSGRDAGSPCIGPNGGNLCL